MDPATSPTLAAMADFIENSQGFHWYDLYQVPCYQMSSPYTEHCTDGDATRLEDFMGTVPCGYTRFSGDFSIPGEDGATEVIHLADSIIRGCVPFQTDVVGCVPASAAADFIKHAVIEIPLEDMLGGEYTGVSSIANLQGYVCVCEGGSKGSKCNGDDAPPLTLEV